MKQTDQARILAEFLVPLLPNLCNASTPLAVPAHHGGPYWAVHGGPGGLGRKRGNP
jgi:hypothetical protein